MTHFLLAILDIFGQAETVSKQKYIEGPLQIRMNVSLLIMIL
jgi:hypothetical protein